MLLTFFAQGEFTGCQRTKTVHQHPVAPTVTGSDQAAIRLDVGNNVSEILTLSISHPVEQLMNREQLLRERKLEVNVSALPQTPICEASQLGR